MDINLGNERIIELQAMYSAELIRDRALGKKMEAFGRLTQLFQRPKPEDIEINLIQKRLEPFWFCGASARYVYDRRATYRVEVQPEVQTVMLYDTEAPVTMERTRGFALEVIEHCVEEPRIELMLDAKTGHEADFSKYLAYQKNEVAQVADLEKDGAMVVLPEMRGSFVVRKLTSTLVKTFHADKIYEERVDVDEISLYYRPVYAVEYLWKPKQQTKVYEFDALTGEVKAEGGEIKKKVARVLENDTLFDIGADTVGTILPGVNVAIKLGRLAARKAVK
jgi:hypothetical protein